MTVGRTTESSGTSSRAGTDVERIVLAPAEAGEVERLLDQLLGVARSRDAGSLAEEVRPAAEGLPLRLRQFLVRARQRESEVFLVSGLPVSTDLPPTPENWAAAERTGAGLREELVLLLCGSLVGDPFCWSTQQNGRLVHDVCPAPQAANSKTSASSLTALSLHTEDVHHPCRADYVSLFCLRNPDAVATSVSRIDDAVLSPETRQLLRQDRFRFHPDDSHTGTAARPSTGPVLFGPAAQPYLRFDAEFMSGLDDAASAAIGETEDSLRAAATGVVLKPGDLAFVDNYRVVHGRRAFAARFDGQDRWLKRINLTRDLRNSHRTRDVRSRVIG
ncbi:hypothetical protein GCM10009565_49310 [Amycolatopsis albidoflavus]